MTSTRLVIGIIVGIFLSFFMVSFFTMWLVFDQIEFYAGDNIIKTIAYLIEANFVGSYNIFDIFSGPFNIIELINSQFLSWIFIPDVLRRENKEGPN